MPENQNDSVETDNTVTDVETAPAAVFIEAPQADVQQDDAPQTDSPQAEAPN